MRRLVVTLLGAVAVCGAHAPGSAQEEVAHPDDLVIHPLTAEPWVCSEHVARAGTDP